MAVSQPSIVCHAVLKWQFRCHCKGALMAVCFNVYAKFRAYNRAASFNPALFHYTKHWRLQTRTLLWFPLTEIPDSIFKDWVTLLTGYTAMRSLNLSRRCQAPSALTKSVGSENVGCVTPLLLNTIGLQGRSKFDDGTIITRQNRAQLRQP
jgi:hypothetical protein